MGNRSLLLLVPAILASSGCHVGMYSSLDGSGPIPERELDSSRYHEVGDGPAGALVLAKHGSPRSLLILANGEERHLELKQSIRDGQVTAGGLYSREGGRVLRRELKHPKRDPRIVGQLDKLRGFRVAPGGNKILLMSPRGVVLQTETIQRTVYDGDPIAVAWDTNRGAIWIASRSPLAVIDCIRLSDLELLYRVPLPIELESPSLQITLSGEHLMVHAHDRPLEAALLISPAVGRATSLGNLWGSRASVASGPPPLIPLQARHVGERLSIEQSRNSMHFGHVAAYPDGQFLVADNRRNSGRLSLSVFRGFKPGGRGLPRTSRVACPSDWPSVLQGMASDEGGVTLVSGPYLLRVTPEGCSPLDPRRSFGDTVRRGFNVLFNLPLAALEAALFLPANTVLSALAVPFGVVLFAMEPSGDTALVLTAPLWFPVAATFNLVDF